MTIEEITKLKAKIRKMNRISNDICFDISTDDIRPNFMCSCLDEVKIICEEMQDVLKNVS